MRRAVCTLLPSIANQVDSRRPPGRFAPGLQCIRNGRSMVRNNLDQGKHRGGGRGIAARSDPMACSWEDASLVADIGVR